MLSAKIIMFLHNHLFSVFIIKFNSKLKNSGLRMVIEGTKTTPF